MKIRTGFVSNSSSSSFCIIGIADENTIFELMKKDGFPTKMAKEKIDRWTNKGVMKDKRKYEAEIKAAKDIEILDLDKINGGYGFWELEKKEPKLLYLGGHSSPSYAGLNGDALLQKRTIPEAKKYFVEYIEKEYGKKIEEREVEFIYGEVSS